MININKEMFEKCVKIGFAVKYRIEPVYSVNKRNDNYNMMIRSYYKSNVC